LSSRDNLPLLFNINGVNSLSICCDFILSWIKGGVGFKPTNSKTLRLNGIKWKGVSVKDIELLSSFVNEAYSCYISGEISMGSTNISRNEKKIIDDFQKKSNIDVKIRYPYPSVLINETNDIVAGEDIAITSTIFADEFSEDENFNITYVFVKEVGASTNSNILHDLNTGKYYEQLSVNSIRNGSVSLKTDAYDKKKVILTTKEVICGEDTEILLASKFTYKNEIKFDVISFVIKDPTYANRGELIGPSSITSLTYEQGTYEYTLKLYTDKGDAPIGTIIKTWTLEGEGLNYIIDDGYVDENGLKLIITTNKSTPERADKLIIKVAIDNHNDAHRDFIIEKEVLILNENIIMTSQSNKVVMDICYRNGLSANSDAMSRDEAIAVTDIKNYFSNISSEFSFDELQFFTNVHTLKDNAFKNSNITSIILHNNITTICDGIFEVCKKLRNVTLPDNIEVITEKMFLNCSSLETLYLPDTVKVIKPMAFGGTKIEKILFNEMKTKTLKVI
jgi:hypothetical protein